MPYVVDSVECELYSAEEIERLAVVEVNNSCLYEHSLPKDHGVEDVRLGTSSRKIRCSTCYNSIETCPTHTGFAKLHWPVYHSMYMDTILKTLRCVCYWCSALLVEDHPGKLEIPKKNLAYLSSICKNKQTCPACKGPQPKWTKSHFTIKTDFSHHDDGVFESKEEQADAKQSFTTKKALQILSHISDEALLVLGFKSHPKNMVLTTFMIMAPAVRPSVVFSEGSRNRGNDDLSLKLQDIVKINNQLKAAMDEHDNNVRAPSVAYLIDSLQANVAQYFYKDTSKRASKRKSGGKVQQIQSIGDQMKGKTGQIRGKIMGKRCNRSSRSVIGPDASIDIDQLVVPTEIAMTQTYPERVTDFNVETLRHRVLNGPDVLFGAKMVDALNGQRINLAVIDRERREKIQLRPGMVVHRHLQNDDYVAFNRQPSLHKESMMAHRVLVRPGKTFRFNLCVTKPYNADFDGDEMNMHCPQSLEARAELRTIMHVDNQIVSPQSNRPIIGAVQDTVSGSYIMTWKDTFFTREQFQQLMMEVHYADDFGMPPPAILKPKALWTGKQIVSYLLPKKLFSRRVVRNGPSFDPMDAKERTVIVEGGQLLCGSLCKKSIGTSELGFVHIICQDISNTRANHFLSDLGRCVASFFRGYGFSIGLGDCVTSMRTQQEIHASIESVVDSIVPGAPESNVFPLVQKALERSGRIVMNNLSKSNNIFNCVTSGAKGSNINLGQIMGCVGQQAVNGKRMVPNPRTLPSCYDLEDPFARGFVANSYLLGLSPNEFYFHAMGGREGMIDTAVKTASTGYIQRKLTKFLESLVVRQDGTVKDSVGNLMQIVYGGDGYNARYVETVNLPVVAMSDDEVASIFGFDDPTCRRVLEMRRRLQDMRLDGCSSMDTKYRLPVNVSRLMQVEGSSSPTKATWQDVTTFEATLGDDYPMRVHLLCACAKRRGSIPATLFDHVRFRIDRARVDTGEAVGPISSTSIGEPTTQMSASYDTEVIVEVKGRVHRLPIGLLVDAMLNKDSRTSQELAVQGVRCIGVSDREKVKWTDVTHVSRHPANGRMLKVTTKHARTMKMTASHSFLVRCNNRVVALPGHDLVVGDSVPVVKHLPVEKQERLRALLLCATEGFEETVPGMSGVLSAANVPIIDRGNGISLSMLRRLRDEAREHGVPEHIIDEIDQAINADVWWDPIVRIEPYETTEMVYDFTVNQELQSFMLGNGVFVHNTLNTFHFAGVASKNVTLGVPRMSELMDASKSIKTPMVTAYVPHNIEALAKQMAHALVYTEFNELIVGSYMTDRFDGEMDELLELVRLPSQPRAGGQAWVFILNKAKMRASGISLYQVETAVRSFSPLLDAYVSEEAMVEWECKVIATVPSLPQNVTMERMCRAIQKKVIIQGGSKKITGAMAREEFVSVRREGGKIEEEKQWIIETDGSDLCYVLGQGFDARRCVTNDVVEAIQVLGIEGGYSVLINELTKVLTFDGNYINMRHIGLLAETMCFYGWLRPVSRHGFARVSAPMLKQASFEQPLEVLTDAALWHVKDKMKDVTSAVMFGKPIDVGTGTVRLLAEKKKQEKKPPEKAMPEVPFVGKRRKRKREERLYWDFLRDPMEAWLAEKSKKTEQAAAAEVSGFDSEDFYSMPKYTMPCDMPGPYDFEEEPSSSMVVAEEPSPKPMVSTSFAMDVEEEEVGLFAPLEPEYITVDLKFAPMTPEYGSDDAESPPPSPTYDFFGPG